MIAIYDVLSIPWLDPPVLKIWITLKSGQFTRHASTS